ncbi:phosphonate C-P lyase system protein PhnG [Rhodomicrobium sp. Az07]|uniref:phosphonate C-P lyase system protein PhnG n=1 Tax=Rhodomicrobium sp. Az07 TaxID=2839034 RepID=UPI001BE6D8E7|nr:phosphonate C-P lyase system protein PhnG [Rhodomicrobium sp. Az07]MBT3069304.1 phosphonate C-P lyase system protein PhnG [Rhodomicrobium sp. Az07]
MASSGSTQIIDAEIETRRAAMATFAAANAAELRGALESMGSIDAVEIRKPETGLVMIRGRIGGDGAPFNVGEATVTRCAVRIASGETGFSYLLGRDQEKARLAALCDALWQSRDRRAQIETLLIAPVRERLAKARDEARAKTDATRVDFFTLVRGED